MPLVLARNWDGKIDPSGWWISEKLDGARAYWDGQNRIMWSKQGKQILAPEYFVEKFPKINLDGELWWERGKFQEIMGILHSKDPDRWKNLKFCVFDFPYPEILFEARMMEIEKIISVAQTPYLDFLKMTKCEGKDHLNQFLENVDSGGGEGLMLRQPESLYEMGRSDGMLKVKI